MSPDGHNHLPATSRCQHCQARLAHDQRYCVDCGARRGPLPAAIADQFAVVLEQGVEPAGAITAERSEGGTDPAHRPPTLTLPTPRAAAVAVLGMLGFGVVVGSFGGAGVPTLASAPVIVAMSKPAAQPTSNTGQAEAGTSTSAAITTTITQSASAAALSPAPLAQTVTAASPTVPGGSTPPPNLLGLPPIKHVFLIVLSQQGFGQTFSPASTDSYLSHDLVKQGELIQNYYAVAGSPLANRIALISGQGPTPETLADCPTYGPVAPGRQSRLGQITGHGCVYPAHAETVADQLTTSHLSWRSYVEGFDKASTTGIGPCGQPPASGADAHHAPAPGDPYVTWSNPFLYFSSIVGNPTCGTDVVDLGELRVDLANAATTPAFSLIVPSACDDGADAQCSVRATAGMPPADQLLKTVVPTIERSAAYKADGLILITFDEAPQTGLHADPSACCNTPTYPNVPVVSASAASSLSPLPPTTTTTATDTTSTAATSTPATTTTATTTTTDTDTATTTTATTTTAPPSTPAPPGTGQTTPTGGGGQVGLLVDLPLRQTGHERPRRLLQPLFAAGDDREPVRG